MSGDECEAGPLSPSAPLEWWFKCATTGYGDHGVAVKAVVATGSTVAPGRRCEPAAFGLARYPEPVSAHPTPDGPGVDTKGWHFGGAITEHRRFEDLEME